MEIFFASSKIARKYDRLSRLHNRPCKAAGNIVATALCEFAFRWACVWANTRNREINVHMPSTMGSVVMFLCRKVWLTGQQNGTEAKHIKMKILSQTLPKKKKQQKMFIEQWTMNISVKAKREKEREWMTAGRHAKNSVCIHGPAIWPICFLFTYAQYIPIKASEMSDYMWAFIKLYYCSFSCCHWNFPIYTQQSSGAFIALDLVAFFFLSLFWLVFVFACCCVFARKAVRFWCGPSWQTI